MCRLAVIQHQRPHLLHSYNENQLMILECGKLNVILHEAICQALLDLEPFGHQMDAWSKQHPSSDTVA